MEIISKLKKYHNQEWLYLQPHGELDMASAEEFKAAIITGQQKSGSRLLWLDFSQITFIDSSGLGVILGRYRYLEPLGGKIMITHPSEQVYRLLIASGLHRIINIDRPTAAQHIKEGM